MLCGSLVIPVIAGIIHMHSEASTLGCDTCPFHRRLIGENRPPARSMKCLIIRLGRLLKRMAFEKLARRMRKLWQECVRLCDAVTILGGGRVGHGRSGCESIGSRVGNV